MDISVIVPSFNAVGKMERCLTSLRNQSFSAERYEVIFVDDCSVDGTFAYLQQQAVTEPHWRVLQLPQNSGSPSRPRNLGTAQARGDYVFYLDCDDEILPDTLELHYAHAKATNACIVRGYLLSDDGKAQQPENRVTDWSEATNLPSRIAKIIGKQSSTVPSLIKRSLLQSHSIYWPEDIRVGEDSIFLATLLLHCTQIEYLDHPTFIYNRRASFKASSTQEYGSRELNNHLLVWQRVIDVMAGIGIDYITLRLRVGLQTAIKGLIFRNKGDVSEQDFNRFACFIQKYVAAISSHKFAANVQSVLNSLKSGSFIAFKASCKPRLLIAGHDLKFILPVLPQLQQRYQIEVDEWLGHDAHDAAKSEKLLQWADYIWCEWLLGNAVWYAERKSSHQKLVVRMHRFELGRDFGGKLKVENVHAVFAVSVLFFERLLERFPNIPRQKVRLLHNYVDTEDYQQVCAPERFFNLAMIGIVPYRKGFHHAINLLQNLKQHDQRYRLKVFGKGPQDIPWLSKHQDEMEYYRRCEDMIASYGLADSIDFLGHCDIKRALAQQQVGFVLSLSEDSPGFPGPESFHLAVADGFAAGAESMILSWAGAEYVYSENFIYRNIEDIKSKIILTNANHSNENDVQRGKELMRRYSVADFLNNVEAAFKN